MLGLIIGAMAVLLNIYGFGKSPLDALHLGAGVSFYFYLMLMLLYASLSLPLLLDSLFSKLPGKQSGVTIIALFSLPSYVLYAIGAYLIYAGSSTDVNQMALILGAFIVAIGVIFRLRYVLPFFILSSLKRK